ncbi:MAG: hypothetical protein U9N33_02415 [Campylobacterota bacterium]|nr:hypothetical protein [Campylobacterota bacterium]
MTTVVGMRELARNSNILDGYDYIKVEDKKTHEYKGLFVSAKYADEVEEFLEKKLTKLQQEEYDRLKPFFGIANGEFTDLKTNADIREAYSKRFISE